MRGFLTHLWMTLKLNFRNPQAVVFGYVAPIFFLVAYGSVFARMSRREPLSAYMGQLLTISVLGGACFGMPISLVAERERGVWRRYRLTPMPAGAFVGSVLVARFVIVASAALLQVVLARWIYDTPWPRDWGGLAIGFTLVAWAFLGIGLVISMIANSTHAVQALGQSLFLPMIMIGGVGVPLRMMPKWAHHLASFLPGRYAVQALDPAFIAVPKGPAARYYTSFNDLALFLIGLTAVVAATRLFRWENGQRFGAGTFWLWLAVALSSWGLVGAIAEVRALV
jgi:ABC-type multidrug transport system permease subunit